MKTSSGLLLGVLFTLVVVIVAVVIYFNTRPEEEKTATPTGPSPTSPSIGDLTIAQTLSPDSDSEPYTIEPYTIEYDNGVNEKSLSKNVTFTLNWTNKSGFVTVTKLEVEHYIRGTATALQTVVVNDNQKLNGSWNRAPISVKISGLPDSNTNQYSFIGENMFKVIATYDADNKKVSLYDGTVDLGEGETHPPELVIKREDLTATIDMTGSIEKVFSVSLLESTQGTTKAIVNKSYTFTATSRINDSNNEPYNISTLKGVELISQDDSGTEFKFKYGNNNPESEKRGKYLGAEINNNTKTLSLITVDDIDDASKITFMNSDKDKSGDEPPGDTYRMLRITVPKCITKGEPFTSDNGCTGANGKPTDTEAADTQFLYLFGDHNTNNTGKKWLTMTGRDENERPMMHWKLEETTT